jgi:hypothetical protein
MNKPNKPTNLTPRALAGLAKQINQAHSCCRAAAMSIVESAIKTGELLAQAKAALPHGEWQGWVAKNCTFAMRQAENYLRLYQNRNELLAEMRGSDSRFSSVRSAMEFLAGPRTVTVTVLEAVPGDRHVEQPEVVYRKTAAVQSVEQPEDRLKERPDEQDEQPAQVQEEVASDGAGFEPDQEGSTSSDLAASAPAYAASLGGRSPESTHIQLHIVSPRAAACDLWKKVRWTPSEANDFIHEFVTRVHSNEVYWVQVKGGKTVRVPGHHHRQRRGRK